jgi:ABC-type transport system involved in multi-copper enzyme maturation permease subunit
VKGASFDVVTNDFLFLCAYTIIMLVLAVIVFRKKLE